MTDDNMVERVARGIFRAYVGGKNDAAWDTASEDVRDFYRPIARAAIQEMREPTQTMRIAAGEALYLPIERARELAEEEKFDEFANDGALAWIAMIDAALK